MAHVINDGPRMGGQMNIFRCSSCGASMLTDSPIGRMKFCFHCSVKFGPEPKAEPTEGDWYALGNSVYARRSYGYSQDILVAEGFAASPDQMKANVNVMAASKKLLIAIKPLTRGRHPTVEQLAMAEEAIDAAEGKQ